MRMHKSILLLIALAWRLSTAMAAVTLTDLGSEVMLDNGIVAARWTKSNGNMISLKLNGNELLNNGGRSYLNLGINGDVRSMDGTCTYSLIQDLSTLKEISFKRTNDAAWPMDIDQRFALRDGDSGIYLYQIYEHDASMADADMTQNRIGFRIDPDIFQRCYLEDDRYFDEPTPAEFAAGTPLVPSEARLLADGSVYYKYERSSLIKDADVYGWTGNGKGFWFIRPSVEYYCSGPTKQHILAHQTGTTPFVMSHATDQHYGSTGAYLTAADGDWTKIAGPIFVYLNADADPNNMWDDAVSQCATEVSNWPYTWMDHPEYPEIRGTVTGTLNITGIVETGAMAILAAPNEGRTPHWQYQAKDYIFWDEADSNGDFIIEDVRAGDYWLYVYVDGVPEEYIVKDVNVTAGQTHAIGTIDWTPVDFGTELWKIGTYNRDASEYLHGDDYRHWGLLHEYPTDFPADVNFTIGSSSEAADWNYSHVNVDDGSGNWTSPTWTINFNLASAPTEDQMVLRIPYASFNNATSRISVNGTEVDHTNQIESDSATGRGGILGQYQNHITKFPASLLSPGDNSITLSTSSGASSKNLMYDAIELVERTTPNYDVGRWDMDAITDVVYTVKKYGLIRDDDTSDIGRGNHLFAPGFSPGVDAPAVTTGDGGISGECLDFDGINDAVSRAGAWYNVRGDLAIDLWYKADVGETDGTIIEADDQWELVLGAGDLKFVIRSDSTTATIDTVSTGIWYHVVATYDGDTKGLSLTADGSNAAVTAATAMGTGNANITIGRRRDGDGQGYYAGLIDEVLVGTQPPPTAASAPSPANDAVARNIDVDLDWTEGEYTTAHKVYFGTSTPLDSGDLVATVYTSSYDPGTLTASKTYYWRIDEENVFGTSTGTTYNFTTRIPGDFSLDGTVNIDDHVILALNWLNDCNNPEWCISTDPLDLSYFSVLASYWLENTPSD